MNSAALIMLAVKASLALTVLGVGLRSTPGDATYLLRHRGLLARSFLSMNVAMPLVAFWVAIVFALHPAVKVALIALAMSPIPPLFPNKAVKSGGEGSYAIGLCVAAGLWAIVVVPATVSVFGAFLAVPFHVPAAVIAKLVGASVLIPLAAGIAIQRVAPAAASRAARPVGMFATALLVAGVIPLVVSTWPAMRSLIGNGTLVAIVAITLVGLLVGYLLGGPARNDRTVLALATASRHPAVAIAIATATFPGESLVVAAVLLDLLAGAIASAPYAAWRKGETHAHAPLRLSTRSRADDRINEDPTRIRFGHIPERRRK